MVQLPATAAIKYVADCWVSGAGGFLRMLAYFIARPSQLLAGASLDT